METQPTKVFHNMLVAKVARLCKLPEELLRDFSVGSLLNLLWLFRGEYGDVGDYTSTIHAVYKLIGDELWQPNGERSEEKAKVN